MSWYCYWMFCLKYRWLSLGSVVFYSVLFLQGKIHLYKTFSDSLHKLKWSTLSYYYHLWEKPYPLSTGFSRLHTSIYLIYTTTCTAFLSILCAGGEGDSCRGTYKPRFKPSFNNCFIYCPWTNFSKSHNLVQVLNTYHLPLPILLLQTTTEIYLLYMYRTLIGCLF